MALTDLHWIIPGKLAGSARPGLFGSLQDDLDAAARLRLVHVVTLTEEPLDLTEVTVPDGMEIVHFPIPDMNFPLPRDAEHVCRRVVDDIERGEATLFHCKAGLGRTGLMLAACLVARGNSPGDAIRLVRTASPRSIQTMGQERFVQHFADHLAATTI